MAIGRYNYVCVYATVFEQRSLHSEEDPASDGVMRVDMDRYFETRVIVPSEHFIVLRNGRDIDGCEKVGGCPVLYPEVDLGDSIIAVRRIAHGKQERVNPLLICSAKVAPQ